MPKTVKLGPTLFEVVHRCETVCDAGCCGLDAFDFNAVHVASLLLQYNEETQKFKLQKLESELTSLENSVSSLTPDSSGCVCTIERLNTFFTTKSFAAWSAQIRSAAKKAVRIIEFSRNLE